MTRLTAALLLGASTALATPALSFDIGAMSDDEKAAFGQAVRDYLMDNPEVLVESINVLDARQAEAGVANDRDLIAANADALFQDGHSWVGGNPDGDLTVVEFMDYRCTYCRQAHQQVLDAVEEDGNIRLIMKEFPVLGEDSETSSRFAIAVLQIAGDEAYAKAHDALMTLRPSPTPEALQGIADEIGVDADAVMAQMPTDAVTSVLLENRQLGQTMGVQGTPAFVIGDNMLRGMPQAGVGPTIARIRESM